MGFPDIHTDQKKIQNKNSKTITMSPSEQKVIYTYWPTSETRENTSITDGTDMRLM